MTEPTRNNVLDLVLTSEEAMIENLEIKENLSTSDHNIIYWHLITKTEMHQNTATKFNFSRADYANLMECLRKIDWDLKFQDQDVEKMWNVFSDIMNELIVQFVPKVISKSKSFLCG